jgi:hypothetical protein
MKPISPLAGPPFDPRITKEETNNQMKRKNENEIKS